MRYKAKIKIVNDIEDRYLEEGDVFDLKTVHIIGNQGRLDVHIVPMINEYDKKKKQWNYVEADHERERPEMITASSIDRFCKEVKDAESTEK